MSVSLLPVSVELLQLIAEALPRTQEVFHASSPASLQLKRLCRSAAPLSEDPEFLNSPVLIAFLQLLFLTALSMYGGLKTPILRQVAIQEDVIVRTVWESGAAYAFQLGIWDDQFELFTQAFRQVILKIPKPGPLSASIFSVLTQILKVYEGFIQVSISQLELLLQNQEHLGTMITSQLDPSLLFILLACMPPQEINAMFIYIQQFFPDDLEVRSSLGHVLKVVPYFQTPSSDIHFILNKVQVYFKLYYSTGMPIIQYITQNKTREFLRHLLQNTAVKSTVMRHLEDTLDCQFRVRLSLYQIFTRLLDPICPQMAASVETSSLNPLMPFQLS